MLVLVIILSILVLVLSYTTYNLLRKNEKQEDVLLGYLDYMDQLSKIVEHSNARLHKIDAAGTFKSDDEVGWFFDEIKTIQNRLNKFIIVKTNAESKKG